MRFFMVLVAATKLDLGFYGEKKINSPHCFLFSVTCGDHSLSLGLTDTNRAAFLLADTSANQRATFLQQFYLDKAVGLTRTITRGSEVLCLLAHAHLDFFYFFPLGRRAIGTQNHSGKLDWRQHDTKLSFERLLRS